MVESVVQSHAEIVVDSTEKSKIRVLHVDDELGLLRVAKHCLELQGPFHVDTAGSVEEALAELEKGRYDAVVSDYQMPGKDGLEFLETLRKNGNTIPFIMFTGKGREEVAVKAWSLGADHYVNKTGDPETIYCELAHDIRQAVEKKKALEMRNVCQQRFLCLVENAAAGVGIFDPQGRFTYVNDALANLLDYPARELAGRHFSDFLHKEDKARILESFRQFSELETESPTLEFRAVRKDGRLAYLMAKPTKSEIDGKIVGSQAIIVDITERKKMEQDLVDNQERLQRIFSASPDAITLSDINGNIVECNQATLDILELSSKEELIGKSGFEFIPEKDHQRVRENLRGVLEQGSVKNVEYTFLAKSGREIPTELSSSVLKDSSGKIVGFVSVAKDVTERKKAEEELRESEERFRNIVENSQDVIMLTQPDGIISYLSPACSQVLGYEPAELVGKQPWIFHPDDLERVKAAHYDALKGRNGSNLEYRVKTKTGETRWVSHSWSPMIADNKVKLIVSVVGDITEQRKAENQIKKSVEEWSRTFDAITDFVLIIDKRFRLVRVNKSVCDALQKKPEELIGKHCYEVMHGTDKPWPNCPHKKTLETKEATTSEISDPHLGMSLLVTDAPVFDENGELVQCVHTVKDLSSRKKMEETLRKSEAKYRSLVEQSMHGIVIAQGPIPHIVFANSAMSKILGYTVEELTSLSPQQTTGLVHPDDRELFFGRFKDRLEGKFVPTQYEVRGIRKDGTIVWLELSSARIEYDGQPAVQAMFADITEREKAEAALLLHETRLKSMLDLNRMTEASEKQIMDFALEEIHKITQSQFAFIGLLNSDATVMTIHSWSKTAMKDCPVIFKPMHFPISEAGVWAEPIRQKKPVFINDYSIPIPSKRGYPEGHVPITRFLGIPVFAGEHAVAIAAVANKKEDYDEPDSRNLTIMLTDMWKLIQRKRAEEALRKSEEKLRDLFDNVNDAMIYLDGSGRILDINRRTVEVFGGTREELKGKQFTEIGIFSVKEKPELTRIFASILVGNTANLNVTIKNKKGQQIDLECSVSPVKSDEATAMVVVARDTSERKKAEEELRNSEERLSILFELAPDAYYLSDLKGNFIDGNKAAEKLTGYMKDELIGKSFLKLKLLPRNEVLKAAKLLAMNALGKSTGPDELVLNRKDGTQVPVEIRTHPIKIKDKTLVLGIARDITTRNKNERAIRESQQKFEGLFRRNPEAAVHLDANFKIVDVNPRFCQLFGYSAEEVKGKNINDVVAPEDMREEAESLDKDAKNGYVSHNTVRKRKDGSLVPVSISAASVTFENNLLGYVGIYKDITELKRAQEESEESRRHFQMLFDLMADPVAVVDGRGKILEVTQKVEEITGFKKEELVGKNLLKIKMFGAKTKAVMIKNLAKRMVGMHMQPYEVEVLKKDGGKLLYEINAAKIDYKGKPADLVVFRDVSERKNLEEKLRVVGSLTRHDVRNKLSAVTGNAYLLRRKLAGNPEALEQLADMENAVRNAETIFEFARTYEKLGVEQLVNMNVDKAVDEAASLFTDLKGVRIANECGGLTVSADSLLRQLFYNLVDDSLKYGEKLTQIRVRYEEFEDKLKLIYEDDGVGISKDAKAKLFTEGFTTGKGSGYGLYLIKRMMEVYGWAIEENGEPGKGARFVMTIPRMNTGGRENYKIA